MKNFLYNALAFTILALVAAAWIAPAHAQSPATWYPNSAVPKALTPVNATWGVKVPALAGFDCLGTDADGDFQEGTCTGGGGGSISTSSIPAAGHAAFWSSASTLSSVATGTLSESVDGLEFSAARFLLGGSAALSLTSGYTIPLLASSTEWAAAYASTTALSNSYIRALFSASSPVAYNNGTGAFSITADSIGDTQLAFNTGQNLTTASSPSFASLTLSSPLGIGSGGTNASSFTTNGVVYYDGTRLANNSLVTYDGNTFELTNAPADAQFFNINGAQTITTTTAPAVDMGATVVDNLGSGTYTYFNAGPTYRPTAAKPAFIGFINTVTVDDSSGTSNNITTLTGYQGAFTGASGYTGLITTYRGISLLNPTLTTASMTNFIPLLVGAQSSASNTAAIVIGDHTSVGNNASIATGATSIPTGDWDAYFAADYPSAFVASTTAITSDALVLKSPRAAITAGNLLGGLAWWSDDTNLTAPGIKTASIQALANVAHTGSALDTDIAFSVTNGTTLSEAMRLTDTGNLGIGTSSPSSLLAVSGSSGLWVSNTGSGNTAQFDDAANDTTPFVISATGNTGVGTSSPYSKLAVTNAGTDPSFVIEDQASPDATPFIVTETGDVGIGTSTPGGKFEVYKTGVQTTGTHFLFNASDATVTNDADVLTVQTGRGTGADDFNLFRITTSGGDVFNVRQIGNVGVGTTSPYAKLSVAGTAAGTILSLVSNTGTKFLEMLNTGVTTLLGTWDFTSAILRIPNGTNPTADDPGEIANDTTDNHLIVDDRVIRTEEEIYKFAIGSTSPAFATSTSKRLPSLDDGYTVTKIKCDVEGGTSKAITLFGETITCDLDGATDDGSIASPTMAANASTTVTMATTTGAVNWLNVTVKGVWTRE